MPHWLTVVLAVAGGLASWRWVIRPLRRGGRMALVTLTQIRDSSRGIERLSREVHELAGAVVQLAVQLMDEQHRLRTDHEQLRATVIDANELLVDLAADFRRLEKSQPRRETP